MDPSIIPTPSSTLPCEITISVHDTGMGVGMGMGMGMGMGIGITTHQIGQQVEPHLQFGGPGLSLAISRKLAKLMNGDISYDCVVGRGSSFHFRVPLPMIINDPSQPPLVPSSGQDLTLRSGSVPQLSQSQTTHHDTETNNILTPQDAATGSAQIGVGVGTINSSHGPHPQLLPPPAQIRHTMAHDVPARGDVALLSRLHAQHAASHDRHSPIHPYSHDLHGMKQAYPIDDPPTLSLYPAQDATPHTQTFGDMSDMNISDPSYSSSCHSSQPVRASPHLNHVNRTSHKHKRKHSHMSEPPILTPLPTSDPHSGGLNGGSQSYPHPTLRKRKSPSFMSRDGVRDGVEATKRARATTAKTATSTSTSAGTSTSTSTSSATCSTSPPRSRPSPPPPPPPHQSSSLPKLALIQSHQPPSQANKTENTITEEAQLKALKGKRVLLAEDNVINSKIVCKMLSKLGIHITITWNGSEAVQACIQHMGLRVFDAILMDLQMPELGGCDATRVIRKMPDYEHVPIIALTANVLDVDRQQCAAAGMTGFLAKPVSLPSLIDELWRAFTISPIEQQQQFQKLVQTPTPYTTQPQYKHRIITGTGTGKGTGTLITNNRTLEHQVDGEHTTTTTPTTSILNNVAGDSSQQSTQHTDSSSTSGPGTGSGSGSGSDSSAPSHTNMEADMETSQ